MILELGPALMVQSDGNGGIGAYAKTDQDAAAFLLANRALWAPVIRTRFTLEEERRTNEPSVARDVMTRHGLGEVHFVLLRPRSIRAVAVHAAESALEASR